MRGYVSAIALFIFLAAGTTACQPSNNTEADTAAVTEVLDAFYMGMKNGDRTAVMSLIADDATFVEGGRLETRAQYEESHLPADIEFEQAVPGNRTSMQVTVDRDAAWIIATTEYHGEFEQSAVDFASAQLMVLSRQDSGWKIRAIHWSSRRL